MENKINYKYTTWVLGTLALLWAISHLFGFFMYGFGGRSEMYGKMNKMGGNNMQGMHMMQDGTIMKNSQDMMNMQNMDMGDMTMNDMVNDLKGKTGADLEKAFLNGMIPHHQGAVDMAKILLQDKTIRPEMVKFANDIISAQTAEIEMQKGWLNTWFK